MRRARSISAQVARRGEELDFVSVTVARNGPSTTETESPPVGLRGIFGPFKAQEIDGDRIRSSDLKLLLAAVDVSERPEIGDKVSRSMTGRSYRVEAVQEGSSFGVLTAYVLQLRGEA